MSNIDIVRNVTAELATRTKAQVTGWRWADGVVVFPDIRCPYCKQGVRSPAIWKHTETMLIGQVIPKMGVTPQLEKPSHAHVITEAGGICFGHAKTAYQALFGALNGTPNYVHMVKPFVTGPLMGNHHCDEMDEAGGYICYVCEDNVSEDDVYNFDDETYCRDCFNDIAFYCYHCGDATSTNDENAGSDGYNYCGDCWSTRFFKCEKCDEVGRSDSSYNTPDGSYCEDCYSDNYFGCENCGETTANEDQADYDDESLCQDCFDNNFTKCEDCDEVYRNKERHECAEAEEATEEPHDDWRESVLRAADDLVDALLEDDPENEWLARIRVHTWQRYIDAPEEGK